MMWTVARAPEAGELSARQGEEPGSTRRTGAAHADHLVEREASLFAEVAGLIALRLAHQVAQGPHRTRQAAPLRSVPGKPVCQRGRSGPRAAWVRQAARTPCRPQARRTAAGGLRQEGAIRRGLTAQGASQIGELQ